MRMTDDSILPATLKCDNKAAMIYENTNGVNW